MNDKKKKQKWVFGELFYQLEIKVMYWQNKR